MQIRVDFNSGPYLISNCRCTDIYEIRAWSTTFCQELPAEFHEYLTSGLVGW
jgi:hypothetical protein